MKLSISTAFRGAGAYAAVFVIAWILAILIDPHVSISSAVLIQVANALPDALAATIITATTRRPAFALILVAGCHELLVYIDNVKASVLHEHVIFADFRVVPMLLTNPSLVLGFLAHSPWKIIAATIAATCVLVATWRIWRLNGRHRTHLAVAVALLVFLITGVLPASGFVPSHADWVVFEQAQEAPIYGVLANIIYGGRATGTLNHEKLRDGERRLTDDRDFVKALDQISPVAATAPDIVVVQSESLFDPYTMCGTPQGTALPNIKGSKSANIEVPVFGGRTLQTEFEVLSGIPVHQFPNADFAYLDLVQGTMDALPATLNQLGYRTIAVHPNNRDFWRRSYAFPSLGFQTFIDVSAFTDRDVDSKGHVTDNALVSTILSELDADSGPAFIFVVTIENHGPWTDSGHPQDSEFDNYLAKARLADKAWKQLIEGLDKRGRPAIALIYGDHLPGLVETYAKRCFKDQLRPEEHSPPVAAWSNLKQLRPPPRASYLVPGWILNAATLPKSAIYTQNAALGIASEKKGADYLMQLLPSYTESAATLLQNASQQAINVMLDTAAIGDMLRANLIQGKHGPWVPQDILLDSHEGEGSFAKINLDQKYASITFRPFPSEPGCSKTDPIELILDGRRVGIIGEGPGAMVATVRTSGAQTVEVRNLPATDGNTCPATMLRVIQLEQDFSSAASIRNR